jgi:hypothetical protein
LLIKDKIWELSFFLDFKKIYFPEFEPQELKDIAIGLAECNKYLIEDKSKNVEEVNKENEKKKKIINDIVDFHINWKTNNSSADDVQCFTIREIEAVIKAITDGKSIYNSLLTIYGARYKRDKKEKLIQSFKIFDSLKDLKPDKMELPKEFEKCFENQSLIEVIREVEFSLDNERNVIIVGKEESGITQIARWCAQYFYGKKKMNGKNLKEDFTFVQKIFNVLI